MPENNREIPEIEKVVEPSAKTSEYKREVKDIPEPGKIYRVKFKSKVNKDTRQKVFKAKYKTPGAKTSFLLLPYRWIPREQVEYEVRLVVAINHGDNRNYFGLWKCVPADQKRDEKASLLEQQQKIYDEAMKDQSFR